MTKATKATKANESVWHGVIRDADGTLRCMDPGCPFNNRRPGPDGKRDMTNHRESDLLPATFKRPNRADGPERRRSADTPSSVED